VCVVLQDKHVVETIDAVVVTDAVEIIKFVVIVETKDDAGIEDVMVVAAIVKLVYVVAVPGPVEKLKLFSLPYISAILVDILFYLHSPFPQVIFYLLLKGYANVHPKHVPFQ